MMSIDSKAPLCRDCKHFSPFQQICRAHKKFNLVLGEVTEPRWAEDERRPRLLGFGEDRCGPEGRLFKGVLKRY